MTVDWKIREDSPDWECDREGSELFQLRYFRSLSSTEKFRAVEDMCEAVEYFKRKAEIRRQSGQERTVCSR
jgi:hypothetical protein